MAPALVAATIAPPVRAAAPPLVAGTTVFTATRDAATVVRVPRPASLTMAGAKSPHVEVSGTGRIVGFTFTALRRPTTFPMTLVTLQAGMCTTRGCRAVAPRQAHEYVDASPDLPTVAEDGGQRVTLPPGDYAVRAVTDGSPVRLTLRLAGLSGRTAITVTKPNRLVLRSDSSRDGVAGVNPMREIGVTHRFHTQLGFMFHMALTDYEPHLRNYLGLCHYLDRKPPTGHYQPGCPGAVSEFRYEAGYPTTQYHGSRYGSDTALVPGEWTMGFYQVGAGGPSTFDVVTLWLELG